MAQNLNSFLEHKSLYYDKIDYSIVNRAWQVLEAYVKIPYVIHIIGTNGKGSTGRFLSDILNQKGFDTLHYSSPHIVEFNERIWINGENSSNEELESAHNKLQEVFDDEILSKLTYFEYTTLLALYLSSSRDYLVLEAGLGGEFDATNVVKNDLTLVTPIGLDHQNFLGNTIEEITHTKVRSCDNTMIVASQINKEVYTELEIYKEKRKVLFVEDFEIDTSTFDLPEYLKNNLKHSLSVLKYLGLEYKKFAFPKLFGRCQSLNEKITIDVGHNTLAANVIKEHFMNKKVTLVYNSYNDKDYKGVLKLLSPIIKSVEIIKLDDQRIVDKDSLIKVCEELKLKYSDFDAIDSHKEYLVFGSFLVVEEFLRWYKSFEK